MHVRTAAIAATVLTASLAMFGCAAASSEHEGHESTSGMSASAEANDADIMFASMMIEHHQQAIDMSQIVLDKPGLDPAVAELATAIQEAQGPEIESMQAWLEDWGVDPSASGHMEHGDGMMSEDDMQALEDADGPTASRLFLEQMIEHHEGAVTMAEEQVANGSNPDAIALAESVITTQTDEIALMRDLLTTLP